MLRVTVSSGMLFLNMFTFSPPLILVQEREARSARVVVLTPPPQEPGDAPTTMRKHHERQGAAVEHADVHRVEPRRTARHRLEKRRQKDLRPVTGTQMPDIGQQKNRHAQRDEYAGGDENRLGNGPKFVSWVRAF